MIGRVQNIVVFRGDEWHAPTPKCKRVGAVRVDHIHARRHSRQTKQIGRDFAPVWEPTDGRINTSRLERGSQPNGEHISTTASSNGGKPNGEFLLIAHLCGGSMR